MCFIVSAVSTVNEYVAEKTNNLIPQIVQELPDDDGILLINTLYFKADFQRKFKSLNTFPGDFTLFTGVKQQVNIMSQTSYLPYYETGDAQVCLLPFDSHHSDAALLLILPHLRTPSALTECAQSVLSASGLPHVLSHLTEEYVELYLPKFRTEFDVDIVHLMRKEGVNDATDIRKGCALIGHTQEQLLFPGNGEGCYIKSVLHKTVFDVNEEGVEAAAATVVIMPHIVGAAPPPSIPPPPPIPMHCTRSFALALIRRQHPSAFFSAVITNPPSKDIRVAVPHWF